MLGKSPFLIGFPILLISGAAVATCAEKTTANTATHLRTERTMTGS